MKLFALKMKTPLVPIILAVSTLSLSASFVPMSLEEKSKRADLIIEGSVVSVTRLMPKQSLRKGSDGSNGSYWGAQSIAVVQVAQVWKMPKGTKFWTDDGTRKKVMPQTIMVPCDY